MSRVVVIGGSGHIGSYLTPRLVNAGYNVVCVSRSKRQPYFADEAWQRVARADLDRQAEEAAGTFGEKIRKLEPAAVIDLTCYTPESARQLAEGLRGHVQHFIHCGTIWVHGPSFDAPTTEDQPRYPIDEYGRRKAAIEEYLLTEARQNKFPATILHPGHLVGPGWMPLNPAANFNSDTFSELARGKPILLPNAGQETLHHVHADDVAQAFVNALLHRSRALAQSFHVVSPWPVALADYAVSAASWFGQAAYIQFLPWRQWRTRVSEKDARTTWAHIVRSPHFSIEKAQRLLDYRPRYTSLEALHESVSALFPKPL